MAASRFLVRARTSIQDRKLVAKKSSMALCISDTPPLMSETFARWLVQNLHAYPRVSPMKVVLSVGRSLISLRIVKSSNWQMFLSNLSFITLRHESKISLWWAEGSMKKWELVHRCGSVRKSGNDLWKILAGSSLVSGTRRREWRACREPDILDGVPQFLRRSERVWMESGWKMRTTAPTTDLK